MLRVAVAVQEGDARAADTELQQALDLPPGGPAVERLEHAAVGRHAFAHADDDFGERRRALDGQGEEVRAALVADHQQVLEAGRGEVRRARPAALEERVRAAGGREAHGDRRQLAAERRVGDQPRRQQRRLLPRAQLHRRSRVQIASDAPDQPNRAPGAVVLDDLGIGSLAQPRQPEPGEESGRERRRIAQDH